MPYDAIVIGGSFAGLSAALYLGRARVHVCVLDTGSPRNRFTNHSHGLFGHDGSDPASMLGTMRKQLSAYPTVQLVDAAAIDAGREQGAFVVRLADGRTVKGLQLLLASGITDILPDLPGVAERWGRSVIHCPYCHGYEFADRNLGVLASSPLSVHQAQLIPEWGPTTFFTDGQTVEPDAIEALTARNVSVERERVVGLEGNGPLLSAVRLADGRSIPIDALYIGPRYRFSSDIAERLGCAIEAGPLGPVLKVDEMKATSVAGVFAAGDVTRMGHTVTFACADGVMAALAIHRSRVFPKVAA
jgi:thioredoxin reductase